MVKKLFKHEFKHYLKLFIPIEIIVLVTAVFVRLTDLFNLDILGDIRPLFSVVTGFAWTVYALVIIASIIIMTILAVIRFYKNLYTAEGYLTFTLPVTVSNHIMIKLTAAFAVVSLSVVVALVSLCIACSGEFIIELVKATAYLFDMMAKEFGAHIYLYVLEVILGIVAGNIFSLMVYYTCISIGQLSNKNRVLMAFVWYFVYYMATQLLGTIFAFALQFVPAILDTDAFYKFIQTNIIPLSHTVIISTTVFTFGLSVVLYFVNKKIMTDKLNLE